MAECKTVTLRTRPLKNGMISFYLDYYPGYREQETMKTIRHEGLNIYIYANPKNQRERDFNTTMYEKAEAIRCRRYEAIVNERYDFFDKRKFKADFLEYYRSQLGKHDQKWGFVYQHFNNFAHGKCTFEDIDVDFCNKFREYLLLRILFYLQCVSVLRLMAEAIAVCARNLTIGLVFRFPYHRLVQCVCIGIMYNIQTWCILEYMLLIYECGSVFLYHSRNSI